MQYLTYLTEPGLWLSFILVVGVCLLALAIGRLAPAERGQGRQGTALNLVYLMFHVGLRMAAAPLTTVVIVWLARLYGGPLITMPTSGWGLLWAIPAYTLAMDLAEYGFHRAQHRLPLLWAMHSLHHSDTSLNASTTERHFWLEFLIKAMTIYPLVALLFGASTPVVVTYTFLSLWNFFVHANLRLSLGRFWPCLNMPHYHRLHHSADPRYFNANYASLFPVIDWVFGTAKPGVAGEYPPTGLDTGVAPRSFTDAFLWPWRQRRLQALLTAEVQRPAPLPLAPQTPLS